MRQPDELKTDRPLLWATGTGIEVWNLFQAILADDLDGVRAMLDANPALVRTHCHYRTPLYFAVRENRLAIVRLLFERGADPLGLAVNDGLIDIARDRGYGELEAYLSGTLATVQKASPRGDAVAAAIRSRDIGAVLALLDADPSLLHEGDRFSNRPIHWAVMTRQPELIDELLARGANLEARRADRAKPIQLYNGDYNFRGWRDVPEDVPAKPRDILAHVIQRGAYVDINTACHMGDLNRVRQLLDEDPGLANRPSEYITYYIGSGTPLRNAAARGHIEIVRLLLERGADPNLPEEGIAPKGNALYSAVYNGHHEVARLLLEHGAFPSPPVESSADAMSIAISNEDEAMVDLLASYGSYREVHLLAYYGDTKTAAAMFGANPALANDPEAFSNATSNDKESFIRLMLRYQPDLAARFMPGAPKSRELCEFLFDRGMNANQRNWLEQTPLHEFARRGDVERAGWFLDHGADIHARDEDICSTPLGWAAKFGQAAMVEFLLSRGAKTNVPDDPPWATPLAWARRRGHGEVADLLERAGATR